MNYVLIDSESGRPVPLPFHTLLENEPFTVNEISEPDQRAPFGKVVMRLPEWPFCRYKNPDLFGLKLITEADFMARQETLR